MRFSSQILLIALMLSASGYASSQANNHLYLIRTMQLTLDKNRKDEFQDLYKMYLGQEIKQEGLKEKITQYFTELGYISPQISILEKDLEKGILNVQIKFPELDQILLYGNADDNELINEYISKISDEPNIKLTTLERYISLMNNIPGYIVQYEFRPSASENGIDLALYIEKSIGSAYVSSDSYGDTDLGQMQNIGAVEIYSPFTGNDSINFYGMVTNHPDRLYLAGARYKNIINTYGTSTNLSFYHSENNSTLENPVPTNNGIDNVVDYFINQPLLIDSTQSLSAEIGGSYKYSKSYTADINIARPSNRGVRIRDIIIPYQRLDTESKYSTFNSNLQYSLSDEYGGFNYAMLSFVQGISGSYKNYTTPSDIPDKHFNMITLNASREYPLPNHFSLYQTLLAGHSDHDLPDQEVFFLGGREYGRGFETGILTGNKVLAGSFELRYSKYMEDDLLFQTIQPYIFRDTGYVGKQSSGTSISHLNSYGTGIRFMLVNNFQLDLEIAQPIEQSYIINGVLYESSTVYSIMGSKSFNF
jgi:hemolysin activation/secretion protein